MFRKNPLFEPYLMDEIELYYNELDSIQEKITKLEIILTELKSREVEQENIIKRLQAFLTNVEIRETLDENGEEQLLEDIQEDLEDAYAIIETIQSIRRRTLKQIKQWKELYADTDDFLKQKEEEKYPE